MSDRTHDEVLRLDAITRLYREGEGHDERAEHAAAYPTPRERSCRLAASSASASRFSSLK